MMTVTVGCVLSVPRAAVTPMVIIRSGAEYGIGGWMEGRMGVEGVSVCGYPCYNRGALPALGRYCSER